MVLHWHLGVEPSSRAVESEAPLELLQVGFPRNAIGSPVGSWWFDGGIYVLRCDHRERWGYDIRIYMDILAILTVKKMGGELKNRYKCWLFYGW